MTAWLSFIGGPLDGGSVPVTMHEAKKWMLPEVSVGPVNYLSLGLETNRSRTFIIDTWYWPTHLEDVISLCCRHYYTRPLVLTAGDSHICRYIDPWWIIERKHAT